MPPTYAITCWYDTLTHPARSRKVRVSESTYTACFQRSLATLRHQCPKDDAEILPEVYFSPLGRGRLRLFAIRYTRRKNDDRA
jgi:hypothetical protein